MEYKLKLFTIEGMKWPKVGDNLTYDFYDGHSLVIKSVDFDHHYRFDIVKVVAEILFNYKEGDPIPISNEYLKMGTPWFIVHKVMGEYHEHINGVKFADYILKNGEKIEEDGNTGK